MIAKAPSQVVFVIDDDASMRDAISRLLHAVGVPVQTFASAKEFLSKRLLDVPACVVLDVRLPGLSGLDLQREMVERGIHIPVIFITGHGDIPMTVQAMKAGAMTFFAQALPRPGFARRHSAGARTRLHSARAAGRDSGTTPPLCLADAMRARSDGPGGDRGG
jgi:FixJ family two-component response regulator